MASREPYFGYSPRREMNVPENTERARDHQAVIDGKPALKPLSAKDVAATKKCREMLDEMDRLQQIAAETPACRLRRLRKHEALVKGLQEMLLARPTYGDKACDKIKELLRG